MLSVQIDRREKAARFGLNVSEIQDAIATAIGGREAGALFEGDRRFDIQVRLADEWRNDVDKIQQLPIRLANGDGLDGPGFVRLADVASVVSAPRPGADQP